LVLLLGVMGFVLTNLDAKTEATIWDTTYRDVPLYLVVILSVLAGAVYVGVIAVTEGAAIRLANRRLTREVQRLENEITFYRTQPSGPPRAEPDAMEPAGSRMRRRDDDDASSSSVPTAPVYDGEADWSSDPDDDAYSGGRAV
jgi:uncharacterized integral membrane protein